jgi:TRAP transporter 4TM/12TM fusion protein
MTQTMVELQEVESAEKRNIGWLAAIPAFALTVFQIYTAGTEPLLAIFQRDIHLGLSLMLAFIIRRIRSPKVLKQRWQMILFDIGVNRTPSFLALVITVYVLFNGRRMILSPWASTPLDLFLGAMLVILILEACRRLVGWTLTLVAVAALLYSYLGLYFPQLVGHKGFPLKYIIEQMFMSMAGIWGVTIAVSANVIAIFIIFGTVLLCTGGAKGFIEVAIWAFGKYRGGAAKVAVISSALFGSVSGSAVANVATTGNFTIPFMKDLNYRPEQAAAFEATASTGGQIMPPIMGAGAFVMAELLRIPYTKIVVAAMIPAILFFTCVITGVHLESLRSGLGSVPKEMIPKTNQVFSRRNTPLFIPLGVFIFYLVIGALPMRSVFNALIVAMVLFVFTDLSKSGIGKRMNTLFHALVTGGITIVSVAVLCATAQIIISVFGLTGIGVKLTHLILSASGGILVITLFLAMISALFLGLGIPTTAAYILVAAAIAPALGTLGLPKLSVHLFLFYFACLSSITPPVCAAIYVAATMAKADWVKTALMALKLALAGIIVPYIFVLNPELLLVGEWSKILLAVFTAFLGTTLLSIAAIGYFMRPLFWPLRLLLAVISIWVMTPGIISDLLGIVSAFGILGIDSILSLKGRQQRSRPHA